MQFGGDSPWSKQGLINMINSDKEYDYIYKYGCHSFGIGIIQSRIVNDTDIDYNGHCVKYGEHQHKYLYCIMIEKLYEKTVKAVKISICMKDPYHWWSGRGNCTYNYINDYKQKNILKNDQVCDETLCMTLNYSRNEMNAYYNDEKIDTFYPKNLANITNIDNTPFYPTFCIISDCDIHRNL